MRAPGWQASRKGEQCLSIALILRITQSFALLPPSVFASPNPAPPAKLGEHRERRTYSCGATSSMNDSECELNSGAYMHMISAMPV